MSAADRSAPPAAVRRSLPPALRVVERHARVYRRLWHASAVSTFLEPVLFLSAMGLGLGTLVDRGAGTAELGIPYVVFLGPGLMVAAAMQTAAGDASFGVMAGVKWLRFWHGVLASPVGVGDLVIGHLVWSGIRVVLGALAFALVLVVFGALPVGGALAAIAPAVLTGLAFAAPISAWTATRDSDSALASLFRFGIVPMFLFSGVFFPVTQLPGWLQPVAYATPLWHGVALARAVATDAAAASPWWLSVAYLVALTVGGAAASTVTFRRRLQP